MAQKGAPVNACPITAAPVMIMMVTHSETMVAIVECRMWFLSS